MHVFKLKINEIKRWHNATEFIAMTMLIQSNVLIIIRNKEKWTRLIYNRKNFIILPSNCSLSLFFSELILDIRVSFRPSLDILSNQIARIYAQTRGATTIKRNIFFVYFQICWFLCKTSWKNLITISLHFRQQRLSLNKKPPHNGKNW